MSLKDKFTNPTSTSAFGLKGEKGPEFENEGQMFTSDIQARTSRPTSRDLKASQDLLSGRSSNQIPLHPYYQSPTKFSHKGDTPSWGTYRDKGPSEGRY